MVIEEESTVCDHNGLCVCVFEVNMHWLVKN